MVLMRPDTLQDPIYFFCNLFIDRNELKLLNKKYLKIKFIKPKHTTKKLVYIQKQV